MKKQLLKRFKSTALTGVLFAAALTVFTSCDEAEGSALASGDHWIKFIQTSQTVEEGKTLTLVPSFSNNATKNLTFAWSSDNEDVATVDGNQNSSAEVTAHKVGTAVIKVESTTVSGLSASCAVTVTKKSETGEPDPEPQPEPEPEPGDGKIRILAIGNSFSQDAVEQYLWNLADAEDIEVIIGNMYIGGCSLERHVTNLNSDAAAYEYRKVMNGTKTNTGSTKLSTAIADEPWDYISLQQASDYSGVYSTFAASLPTLAAYVRERSTNRNMQLMLHQTWAYSKNSGHSAFPTYNKDQIVMYNSIVDAYMKAANLVGIDMVIPAGTAIQNGRTSYLGDTFNSDGYHLETTYGRYTAACTWFEMIFETDVVGNSYAPAGVTPYVAEIAQHAAHAAVLKPNEITELTDYKKGPEDKENEDKLEYPIYIDFGKSSTTTESPWNNITSVAVSGLMPLYDSQNTSTGINISITKAFGNINESGPAATTTTWEMPATASRDSFWGNTGAAFENKVTGACELTVSSLNLEQEYEFTFFSSRAGATNNRETQFTVTGSGDADVLLVNASSNTSQTVTTKAIKPTEEGKITISVTSGPSNNDTNGFFYLNAMSIAPTTVQ